jgi:hypothetical protein
VWCVISDNLGWKSINNKDCCQEGFIPIFERHGCMGKEREANFNDMTMFTLSGSILLVCMRARYMMSNA